MSVVVTYKWAANPQDASVGGDGTVDWSRAKASVSEYDPVAIELGRGLADALGTELVGVTVGTKDAAGAMAKKSALSRGLDRAVIVADEALAGIGSTKTGIILGEVVRTVEDVTVILTGDSSVDVGAGLVPGVLAGALGWPLVTDVTAVSGTPGALTVERKQAGGTQVLSVTGPAVLAVATDAVQPRVPGMKDILGAGKKPSQEVALDSLTLPDFVTVEVTATAKPQLAARKGEIVDGSDAAAAATQVVGALRNANVI